MDFTKPAAYKSINSSSSIEESQDEDIFTYGIKTVLNEILDGFKNLFS